MSGNPTKPPGSLFQGPSQPSEPGPPAETESVEMSGNERIFEIPGLSPRQQSALPTVVSSPTIAESARRAGVAESTLRRWLDEPAFRKELDRQREEAYNLALKQVQALVPECLSIFAKVAVESADPALRLRAARYLLSYGMKVKEVDDLRERIRNLEQAVEVDRTTKPMH